MTYYTGCPKKFAIFRGTVHWSFAVWFCFFSGCLTRCVINAARIVLFKSIIKLNNLSSDKKQLYNWQVDFQLSVIAQT